LNCLISDHVHPYLIDHLRQANVKCTYLPNISQSEVEATIDHYEILIVNSKIKINEDFAKSAQKLKIVGRLGSGMDNINVEALNANGIEVVRTPEANANAVSEHVIGMLLSLANHLNRCDREVRDYTWHREKNRGWELANKTIGILGHGHTGSHLSAKLSGWAHEVVSYDKYLVGYANDLPLVNETTLNEVLTKSDIISIHLPLDDDTRGMIDSAFLKSCKPGVVLVNTSRGGIVNTQDLLEGLQRGYVGGACLDVFENEKVMTLTENEKELYNQLYELPNVVLSPHVGGWTYESYKKIAQVMFEKIVNLI